MLVVGRDRGENLAAHAEGGHVEMWLLGRPWQRQRERPRRLKIAHKPRLAGRRDSPINPGSLVLGCRSSEWGTAGGCPVRGQNSARRQPVPPLAGSAASYRPG